MRIYVFAWVLTLVFVSIAPAQGASTDELVAAGKRLYLEGRGISGETVNATVQGDVPVSGTQVTCQSCHGRSGMGTIESGRIPPAITGPFLFSPDIRTRNQRQRPAYTDQTLARAVLNGIDAAGQPLDPLMPHFQLGEGDLAALIAYLRQLGVTPSPGVGKDSLRLATIIAGDVDPKTERAVLDVIETFIAARNRSGPQRLRGGHFPHDTKETYREWSLDVWRITGPPQSWQTQIESYYQKRPVFALIGGLASGPWQPIHDFCEIQQMPCILPDTDLPPAEVNSFYTFYFSRGLRLEADIIASALNSEGLVNNIVSIMDGGNVASVEAASAFEQAFKGQGGKLRTLDIRETDAISDLSARNHTSAFVLWLTAEGIQPLAKELSNEGPPLFFASTMLGANWETFPPALQSRAKIVHLTALQNERDPAMRRFRAWAHVQGVTIRSLHHQALAYFACFAFAEGVKHTGLYLSRDYLLDLLNHAPTLTTYLPLYTRSGITPGQRVLSRGGYLIDLSGHTEPKWVIP